MRFPFLAIAVLLGIAANSCRACDCVKPYAVRNPGLIFEGTAVKKDVVFESIGNSPHYRLLRYTFQVDDKVLGEANGRVFVYSEDSDCQAVFLVGKRYRVIAKKYRDFDSAARWITTACFGNSLIGSTHRKYPQGS